MKGDQVLHLPLKITRPILAPGNYVLIFREWKRSSDRLTDKNTARWIDGQIDR